MTSTWLICALLAAVLTPCVLAQRHAGGSALRGGFAGHHSNAFGQGAAFFGEPFFYTDYPSGSIASEMSSSPIFLQRPATGPEPKLEPLLIEWQGGRYVRFSDGEQGDHAPATSVESVTPRPVAATPALPPAVLIFRDGHQEQVQDYVIASGTLYARGDYWQSGSWRKDIQLSALDIPATLTANQNHGVKFVLPSGPNEVVTRP